MLDGSKSTFISFSILPLPKYELVLIIVLEIKVYRFSVYLRSVSAFNIHRVWRLLDFILFLFDLTEIEVLNRIRSK